VRTGEGQALVVRGEPGVGKTVLLDYLAGRASGCRVARAVGVQPEMELAFAGLHQLCAPMLDHAESLPGPQREALRTAFGLSAGPAPERFLVGLAVLGLLSETAGERPLVCVVDDQQWLDHASAQALGFAARRLGADPVGLVFAARVPGEDVAGLPQLVVEGLAEGDARALLESVLTGPLDARVRDQIIADTHGNPLALLELPRGLTPAQLAGGFGLSSAVPLAGRIEESFGRQLEALPTQTRRLVQLAAADPSGDPMLVWRAAGRLAIGAGAAGPAVRSGQPTRASDAFQQLSETTRASGTDWALGTEARCRALLSEDERAGQCYREAIERLGRTRMRPALARAHLLYGEWLRRVNRRRDARAQLRIAYDMLSTMGAGAFAERARRELLATGDTVRKRTVETLSELTAQEVHIARLAVDGRTNMEIGAQLYLSVRTVEWHLGNVYTKLGVGSRRELRRALASLGQADPQA
jgi:DNA-binding CsgD family transcriptional regulator